MFTTIVIQPLYNALIYLVGLFPGHPLWVAALILTVIFKTILVPLFKKQVRDQVVMSFLAPKLKEIQEKYKDKREILAKETMAMYGKYKVNPFVSILLLILQLPFLFGLYKIFFHDMNYYQHLLYTGISFPSSINYFFLGVDLTEKSLLLAIAAAVSQFILGAFMFKAKTGKEKEMETEIMRAMNIQMKYFLPVVIGVVSYITPAIISFYIIVTNVFGIFQEIIIKKPLEIKVKKELEL